MHREGCPVTLERSNIMTRRDFIESASGVELMRLPVKLGPTI